VFFNHNGVTTGYLEPDAHGGEARGPDRPLPNAILGPFRNRPDPMSFFKGGWE